MKDTVIPACDLESGKHMEARRRRYMACATLVY